MAGEKIPLPFFYYNINVLIIITLSIQTIFMSYIESTYIHIST